MNPVQKLVDFIGSLPGRIWYNTASPLWVPYREVFHFIGGALVAIFVFWNSWVALASSIIMAGVVVYGEVGDVKSGSPLWKSFLDVFIWLTGFATIFFLFHL